MSLLVYSFSMERDINGDVKDKFAQQANLVGSCTVSNSIMVMDPMIVLIFLILAYQDQMRYMYRYLAKKSSLRQWKYALALPALFS